jgi:xanthine/CO dehydrogenase XdhC/CoxF family maturation factor
MTERTIIEQATRLRRRREPFLVAMVVRADGPRAGARMLLTRFRWITGSASGVSLEADLANTGWMRTSDGEPFVLRCEATDGELCAAFGLDGEDTVDIFVERSGAPGRIDPLELAERCLHTQRRGAVVTITGGGRLGARVALVAGEDPQCDPLDPALRGAMLDDARSALETGESRARRYGDVDAFVEAIVPPPCLFIFGTGHDAIPIVELAHAIGWDVAVCAHEVRHATRQRFCRADVLVGAARDLATRIDDCDRAVALVMAHRYDLDRDNLGALLDTEARYIGVLGPSARAARMAGELCLGHPDPRVHAPTGLLLGAETAHEHALAIIAEIQAVLRRAHVPAQEPFAVAV